MNESACEEVAALERELLTIERKYHRTLAMAQTIVFLVSFALACIGVYTGQQTKVITFCGILYLQFLVVCACTDKRSIRRQKQIANQMLNLDDPAVVKPLIDLVLRHRLTIYPGAKVIDPAFVEPRITSLLTRCTPEIGANLTNANVNWIRSRLSVTNFVNTDLIVAVERMELLAAQGEIERLTHTANARSVREVAQRCLDGLREVRRRRQHADALLRPAQAPDDTLLRPAANAPTQDEALLLRPRQGADHE